MTQRTLAEIARERLRTRPAAAPTPPPAAAPSRNGKAASMFEAYYDNEKGAFWVPNETGEWVKVTEAALKRYLRVRNYSKNVYLDNGLTQLEQKIYDIEQKQSVHYAGQLAGYRIGVHEVCGYRVLVTRERKVIAPKEGPFPTLASYLKGLLGEQVQYWHGWIKAGLEALNAGPPFRPGQALAMAGPGGCGKNLAQSIITEIFGGRMAKPFRYMTGETNFNSDLFAAEHLVIQDEAASTDLRIRRYFGGMIKNLLVNEEQSYHRKKDDALPMTPFWRLSITLNDEPENLMVLPPLDPSIKDKIFLLRCFQPAEPFHGERIEDRQRFRQTLSDELPGYLHWLHQWKAPKAIRDVRYGVRVFHDPEILYELENLAPEFRLLSLVDTAALWDQGTGYWEGTAAALERALREWDKTGEVARLLSFNTACGVYLGRLAGKKPDRVYKDKKAGNSHVYRVNQPPDKSLFKSSVF